MENSRLRILNKSNSITRRLIIIGVTLLLTNYGHTQQFNNWYFPNNAGITFNTVPPSPLLNGQAISGSSACISDAAGNLLFYSDGFTVFNKLHSVMNNGDSLKGYGNQSSGLIIIPFLDGSNKYFLVNSDGLTYGGGFNGYTYNIVDMDMIGGLGAITQKNVRLGNYNSSEKLATVVHSNGNDIWLVTKDWLNNYFSYKITCLGINPIPTISTIGFNANNNINSMFGVMKATPNGEIMASVYQKENLIELCSFDKSTGRLSNNISVKMELPFGIEFSSDSKFLYVSSDTLGFAQKRKIYQFDISTLDSATIADSKILINEKDNGLGSAGHLQMGPDRRIYVANSSGYNLDVINNPDVYGSGCNYIEMQTDLGGKQISKSLPFAPTFLFLQPNVQVSYIVANDCRTVILTGKTYIRGSNLSFKWLFRDGDSTIQNVPVTGDTTTASITHFFPPGIDTFFVKLMVTSDTVCGVGNATKAVIVKPPKPTANFAAAINCNSLQVQFTDSSLLNFNPSITYSWQFGDGQTSNLQNPVINYAAFNNYPVTLIVKSPLSCVAGDTITKTIRLLPKPTAAFNIANASCINVPVNFISAATASDSISVYKWFFSNADSAAGNTASFTYSNGGNKTVSHFVQTANGCKSDTVQQSFFIESTPIVEFSNTQACIKQPVYFTNNTTNGFGTVNNYTWQFGNTQTSNSVSPSNEYSLFGDYTVKLIASTAKGCTDSMSKTISIISIQANAGNDTAVFAGTPFTLNGSGGTTYLWQPAFLLNNNQLANPTGTIQNDQQFILTVSNSQQCGSSDTVSVKVLLPLYIPNAFTPNRDGLNDKWVIGNLAGYKNPQLKIFNRYGRVVFSSNDYQNNWDGTGANGASLSPGVYVYLLQIKGKQYNLPVFKGTVTILK